MLMYLDLIVEQTGWDKLAVEYWWRGETSKEISTRVSDAGIRVGHQRVGNRLSELRNTYGAEVVPYDKERRKILADRYRLDKTG